MNAEPGEKRREKFVERGSQTGLALVNSIAWPGMPLSPPLWMAATASANAKMLHAALHQRATDHKAILAALAGKSPAGDIPHYMAAQLLGGLAASLACAAIHSKRLRMTRSQAKLMCSRAFRVKREATGT